MATKLPQQIVGKSSIKVSRIALGCMGMSGSWNPADVGPENVKKAIVAFEASLEAGINFFDHADIYGQNTCESVFKECLKAVPGIREKIVIATKCGIILGKGFDLSSKHILKSIDGSLTRMGIDYVDIYQMHRPDPLAHPRETAKALKELVKGGKVKQVAVSNYYPEQVRALQTYLEDIPIVSNQLEISLLRLAPFYEGWLTHDQTTENGYVGDGVLDQCMAMDITPLAWSPLAKSLLSGAKPAPSDPRKERIEGIVATLTAIGHKHAATTGQIALAWLLKHPAGIVPLVGSNNPLHIHEAALATEIELSWDEWYALYVAAWGRKMP